MVCVKSRLTRDLVESDGQSQLGVESLLIPRKRIPYPSKSESPIPEWLTMGKEEDGGKKY